MKVGKGTGGVMLVGRNEKDGGGIWKPKRLG